MIIKVLIIALLGAFFGALFGMVEAAWRKARLAVGNKRKLPHAWLLTTRLAISGAIGLVAHGFDWPALLYGGAVFVVLTMVHRQIYSRASGQPWWYMGDGLRELGDSWYDTIMWTLARFVWKMIPAITTTVTPFYIATLCEGAALCFLIAHLP